MYQFSKNLMDFRVSDSNGANSSMQIIFNTLYMLQVQSFVKLRTRNVLCHLGYALRRPGYVNVPLLVFSVLLPFFITKKKINQFLLPHRFIYNISAPKFT